MGKPKGRNPKTELLTQATEDEAPGPGIGNRNLTAKSTPSAKPEPAEPEKFIFWL